MLDLPGAAALGPGVVAALSDENDLGPEVTGWVVASRARHAAELAAADMSAELAS